MYKLLQPHLCVLSPTAKNLRVQLSGCKTIQECRNILDIISRMIARIEGATIDPTSMISNDTESQSEYSISQYY